MLSRDVDPEVLAWIYEHNSTIPQKFLVGNQYLTGTGSSWRSKMSAKYVIAALGLLGDEQCNKKVGAESFAGEFCAPLRHLEIWEGKMLRTFGKTASTFPAFMRLMRTCLGGGVVTVGCCWVVCVCVWAVRVGVCSDGPGGGCGCSAGGPGWGRWWSGREVELGRLVAWGGLAMHWGVGGVEWGGAVGCGCFPKDAADERWKEEAPGVHAATPPNYEAGGGVQRASRHPRVPDSSRRNGGSQGGHDTRRLVPCAGPGRPFGGAPRRCSCRG